VCCVVVADMAKLQPITRPKIVKKRTARFVRHQSDRYNKLKVCSAHQTTQPFPINTPHTAFGEHQLHPPYRIRAAKLRLSLLATAVWSGIVCWSLVVVALVLRRLCLACISLIGDVLPIKVDASINTRESTMVAPVRIPPSSSAQLTIYQPHTINSPSNVVHRAVYDVQRTDILMLRVCLATL
jgi:hypothetical protein